MSVLDDLRAAEERVAQRLKELEPAVAEYRELEAVAERLGIDATAAAPAAPTTPGTPARSTKRARRRASRRPASAKRTTAKPRAGRRANAKPGERGEQLLALVRSRPGVTVREAGAEIGVDPTSLYRIVHRLEERGELRKKGRGLEAVSNNA